MSNNLFKKAAMWGDLHLGLKSNSITHNTDCLNYVKWATDKSIEEGCDTCIFLGDHHHNRASINIVTLNYSISALEYISSKFDRILFIPGNHDNFYRDRRDVHSASWAKHLPNIEIVDQWLTEGDCTFVPWLIDDEYKKIAKVNSRYMFGHFELPGYLMNAMVRMPEGGDVKVDDFKGIEHVYTGHFHKRQTKNNVTYIGSCFPHNYADAGDDERGLTILEWGQQPQYYAWPDQPRYRVFQLSDVLKHTERMLHPNMHVRVNLDIDISYEEANFIKETFVDTYKLREIVMIPSTAENIAANLLASNGTVESVDNIVHSQLAAIDTTSKFDPGLLSEIYRNL